MENDSFDLYDSLFHFIGFILTLIIPVRREYLKGRKGKGRAGDNWGIPAVNEETIKGCIRCKKMRDKHES